MSKEKNNATSYNNMEVQKSRGKGYRKKEETPKKKQKDVNFYIKRCEDEESFDIYLKIRLKHSFMVLRQNDLYSVRIETDRITGNILSIKKHVEASKIQMDGFELPEKLHINFYENGVYVNITIFKKFYMCSKLRKREIDLEQLMEDLEYTTRSTKTYSPTDRSLATIYVGGTNLNKPYRCG